MISLFQFQSFLSLLTLLFLFTFFMPALSEEIDTTITTGDTAWILTSSCLVFLMLPGLGLFYSGMTQTKNSLALLFICLYTIAIISIQWFMLGYTLTFTRGNQFIGDLSHAFLINVEGLSHPAAPAIPEVLFMFYQMMFAIITPALALGSVADRIRFFPITIFLFCWSTFVYNPIAHWTWSTNGWANHLGNLDFAGGTPVHISSGFAGLAMCFYLGRRHGFGEYQFKPDSYTNIMIGTALLWFGWFGFNGGSALSSTSRGVMAAFTTNLSACFGGLTWCFLSYRHAKKFSSFGFCSGVIAGLVAVTPASGFIYPWFAPIFGIVAGFACHFACDIKLRYDYDDSLDVFAVHGVGGLVGNLLTGIFAESSLANLGASTFKGGFLDGNFIQIFYQLANSFAGAAWSFCITYLLMMLIDHIPFLNLRIDPEGEILGVDISEMGEYQEERKSQ